jgi:hypothetical protein
LNSLYIDTMGEFKEIVLAALGVAAKLEHRRIFGARGARPWRRQGEGSSAGSRS